MVEPNFSCYLDMPRAVGLWAVYRKRWLARYWQSQGIRVFVDLNVATPHRDINLLGVPRGWKSYCTRAYSDRLEQTDEEYTIACEHAQSSALLFVVYGGGKGAQALARKRGWTWLNDQQTLKAKGKAHG